MDLQRVEFFIFQKELIKENTDRGSSSSGDWATKLKPLKKFIEEQFPQCVLKDEHPGYVQYQVENSDLKWSDLFRQMEIAKEQFSLEAYSVGQATLEQVFLSFAKDQDQKDM